MSPAPLQPTRGHDTGDSKGTAHQRNPVRASSWGRRWPPGGLGDATTGRLGCTAHFSLTCTINFLLLYILLSNVIYLVPWFNY